MYHINISKRAEKKLDKIPEPHKSALSEAIGILGANPDNRALDVKKLRNEPGYRMRVGNWRVIFDRNDLLRIIDIEKIGSRGDVYK